MVDRSADRRSDGGQPGARRLENFAAGGTEAAAHASRGVTAVPIERSRSRDIDLGLVDFDAFFAAHLEPISRALALSLGNTELGRDAAAEAMARAYQRWGRVSTYGNPSGWVYRVGLNWGRSRLRKRRREVQTAFDPERAVEPTPAIDSGLDVALRQLPLPQRAVVVCRYYFDWSEAQTATALGVAPGTVKSRMSRALERLGAELGQEER